MWAEICPSWGLWRSPAEPRASSRPPRQPPSLTGLRFIVPRLYTPTPAPHAPGWPYRQVQPWPVPPDKATNPKERFRGDNAFARVISSPSELILHQRGSLSPDTHRRVTSHITGGSVPPQGTPRSADLCHRAMCSPQTSSRVFAFPHGEEKRKKREKRGPGRAWP